MADSGRSSSGDPFAQRVAAAVAFIAANPHTES
jgi:hypothetical protein